MSVLELLFQHYSLGFFIHLLVMMIIFVHGFPKRTHFPARFISGCGGCLIACYCFPEDEFFGVVKPFFLVTFFLVCLFVWFCYEMKFIHVFFYCTAMYAMQNLCYHLYALISVVADFYVFQEKPYMVLNYCMSFALCTAIYYLYVRKKKMELDTKLKNTMFIAVVCLVLFVVFILNSSTGFAVWDEAGYVIINVALATCCVLALLFQFGSLEQSHLRVQSEVMEQILHLGQQQHELSKKNIELINMKCHDIKHQINLLRKASSGQCKAALKEMEDAVMVYDSIADTGNDALDIILTEKSLYCERYKIRLACMVDGEKLRFMSTADVYSLFGNVLDNAIESVIKIQNEEKRIINFNVSEKNGFLVVHVENLYEGKLKFRDGLPQTTKSDNNYHGFGMQSIRYITEKYNGKLMLKTEKDIFALNIVMPLKR